jgi:hypothetical protein
MEVPRELIRDEILAYLNEHMASLELPVPGKPYWIRGGLFELIRAGILIQIGYKAKDPERTFDFTFEVNAGGVLLSEYGRKFLSEQPSLPYFTESYLNRLREVADPGDELQAYLSEGLACLRSSLGRAAALLLRLAVEHMLNLLAESTERVLESNKAEKDKFIGEIRRAGVLIEKRTEVILNKLEFGQDLIPQSYFRDGVKHKFRATVHSIRSLGGKAAHISTAIQIEEVQDHYVLFTSTVYPLAMRIIEHQRDDLNITTELKTNARHKK